MPTIVANSILSKASILLQDTTNVRWTVAELLGWLNDGLREIAAARPDQSSKYTNVSLAAGTRQSLPADGIELLRVVRNMGADGVTAGLAVRKVPHELLDSQVPSWHSNAPAATIKHYTYEPRAPHTFYVYPPSDGTTKVEILYAAAPAQLVNPTDVITIDDIYANIVLDYILFRAYSKDYEETADAERAVMHRKAFSDSLGAKTTADSNVMPKDQVRG